MVSSSYLRHRFLLVALISFVLGRNVHIYVTDNESTSASIQADAIHETSTDFLPQTQKNEQKKTPTTPTSMASQNKLTGSVLTLDENGSKFAAQRTDSVLEERTKTTKKRIKKTRKSSEVNLQPQTKKKLARGIRKKLAQARREQKAALEAKEYDIGIENVDIKINYPVFVTSLFKSGTTSVHAYFKCGKQNSVHWEGKRRTGYCIRGRIISGNDFIGCGGEKYDIYTDNDASCYIPTVRGGLENFYKFHPNGTLLNAVRDSQSWLDSVIRFRYPNWALIEMLRNCTTLYPDQVKHLGNRTLTNEEIRQFYLFQNDYVRNFAKEHPSLKYIEVRLEDDKTGAKLEEEIGIPSQCWGQRNVNTRITTG